MLIFPYPLPYNMPYQIDIWTKTRQDWRYLVASLQGRFSFTDSLYLSVDIPGYGEQLAFLRLDSIDDTSDLETGEEDRVLRATVSLTLEGWLYRVPVVKKTVLKAHAVILDASGDSDNLLEGSAFADWYCDPDHYNYSSDFTRLLSVDESPDFAPPNRTLFWVSYNRGTRTEVGTQAV